MEGLLTARIFERIEEIASRILPFGISFLDDATLGIGPEELVIIGARTGTGKTELLNLIAEGASRKARVAFFSLESHELEIEQRTLYREIKKLYTKLTAEEQQSICKGPFTYTRFSRGAYNHELVKMLISPHATEFQNKYQNLKVLYRKNPSAKTIENDILSMRGEVDLWILDHLHFLNYESRDELDAVRQAMKLFYELAANQKAPLIIASHLRKDAASGDFPTLADLHGSSEISKRAVTVILIDQGRPQTFLASPNEMPTIFNISKFRIDNTVRRVFGLHHFDTIHRTYSANYVLLKQDKDGELEIAEHQPEWAHHAVSKKELEKNKTLN